MFALAGRSPEFTAGDARVLQEYSGPAHMRINFELRRGRPSGFVRRAANRVSEALLKLPDYRGTVTRGVELTREEQARYAKGAFVSEAAFTSSSKHETRWYALNTLFVIHSKTGKDISDFSDSPEGEVLFDQGARFEVLTTDFDSERNAHVIELAQVA